MYVFDNDCLVREACVHSIRLWPLRRDDSSRILIGTGGTSRSNWAERASVFGVRARSDR